MKKKGYDFVSGQNHDNSWMGCAIPLVVLFLLAGFGLLMMLAGCSPKVIVQKETITEYRDRLVHDTTTVEIPYEVEKVVTKDTASHLENTYAKSDAIVSGGLLSHSLESRPQIIKVPVEVHVTDTLVKKAEIRTETIEVEKPLSWWQKFRIDAFWWLLGAVILCLLWIFRKLIF
jgi:hypothetical protein